MRWLLLLMISMAMAIPLSLHAQMNRGIETAAAPRFSESVISGEVTDAHGAPVPGALVSVNGGVAAPAQTYTRSDGTFALTLPVGSYEVSASDGMERAVAQVDVLGGPQSVNLHFPAAADSQDNGQGAVSVRSLTLPKKAREELEKAQHELVKGRAPEALEHVNRVLVMAPNSAEALTVRGLVRLAQNDRAGGQSDLDAAIRADANYSVSYVVLAAAENDAGHFDQALRLLNTAVRLDAQRWQTHFELARALAGKEQLEPALREVESGERLCHQPFAPLMLLKGVIAQRLHRVRDALQAFEQFLHLDPHGEQAPQVRALVAQLGASAGK